MATSNRADLAKVWQIGLCGLTHLQCPLDDVVLFTYRECLVSLLNAQRSKPSVGGPTFSLKHRLLRAIWYSVWLFFAVWTPAPLHKWRIFLLCCFGAKIKKTAHVYGSARIWYPSNLQMGEFACLGPGVICYCMAPVILSDRALVSQGAHLCAGSHDYNDPHFQLIAKPIVLGADVWVCAEAFVGLGVEIADGVVIGARSVVTKSIVEPWTVHAGNPCRPVGKRNHVVEP